LAYVLEEVDDVWSGFAAVADMVDIDKDLDIDKNSFSG